MLRRGGYGGKGRSDAFVGIVQVEAAAEVGPGAPPGCLGSPLVVLELADNDGPCSLDKADRALRLLYDEHLQARGRRELDLREAPAA